MKVAISSLLALTFVFVVSSAVAQNRLPSGTEERNEAVGYALASDIFTNSLAKTCAPVLASQQAEINSVRAAWKARNGGLIDSAHRYLQYISVMKEREGSGVTARQFYEKTSNEITGQAVAALYAYFPSGRPDFESCERARSEMSGGEMDLSRHRKYGKVLADVSAEMMFFRPIAF